MNAREAKAVVGQEKLLSTSQEGKRVSSKEDEGTQRCTKD